MSPLTVKLLMALSILAAGWIGGWIPVARASPAKSGGNFMAWGNAFAAGIFLGTGLLHMLPEAHEAWGELGWTYPMALLLAALGFMALLLFEHVLLPPSAHAVAHAHAGEPLAHREVELLGKGRAAYALLLALSVHSVIAGLALGAQTSPAGTVATFAAIIAHKSTAAFSLGVSLVRSSSTPARSRLLITLFALATPIGVLAGALLGHLPDVRYVDATFLALAAGTFLYIASVDILQDEFLRAGGRFTKWLFAMAALALTAALSLWL